MALEYDVIYDQGVRGASVTGRYEGTRTGQGVTGFQRGGRRGVTAGSRVLGIDAHVLPVPVDGGYGVKDEAKTGGYPTQGYGVSTGK